jgi:hypothetical protein
MGDQWGSGAHLLTALLLQDSDDEDDDEKAGMKGIQATHSRASGRLLDQSRETLVPNSLYEVLVHSS